MAQVIDRHRDRTEPGEQETRSRPVVLGTLSVRVDPSAERMAVDSAIEAGVPLVIANILPLRPYPTTLALVGPEGLNLPHEEDLDAVRATAARAAELGVETELLRVTTRHPVNALLEIVRERNAGLLVFGPDLKLVGRIRFRLAARRLRREAGCLIWVAPDGQSNDVVKRERHDRPPAEGPGTTAERAAKLGLSVEHLRVSSPRPARALVQIANERGAGLLVLGPRRRRLFARRGRFDRAARAVRRSAACLVWIPA